MEMHPTLTEEERNGPLWPWEEEVISGADYRQSLEGLKQFVEEVDVTQLHTLEDLSAVASLVGHNVYVVAVTKGTKREKKTAHFEPTVGEPISRVEREYVFTHRSGNQEMIVTASKGHSLISRYRLCGFHRYLSEELRIRLPSDRDIAIGEKPNVDEQSLYVKDLRGLGRAYHPAKEPNSPEIQQVFAQLLKDALSTLREVISALA